MRRWEKEPANACHGKQEEGKDSRGASFWDVREKVEMGK
jgi:hypothetical protein